MLRELVLIGLICTITASEVQNGVPALLTQIRELRTSSEKGEEFKNLLELELNQGSQVDEVVTMIGDLLTQLRNDQQMEDLEHASKITGYNLDIAELEINVENLSQERSVLNQFIQTTANELSSLQQTIENTQAQLELLNGREEDIRNIRAEEQVAYQHRTQNNNRVLAALGEILTRLSNAVFNKQGTALLETERQEIVDQIKRELGYNNQIAVLISLTSKFDEGVVTRIIEKLENIRDAIQQNQVDEDTREVNAASIFQSVLQEISEVRQRLAQDLQATTQVFRRKSNEKVSAERTVNILNRDIETTQQILVNTRTQRDSYEANYQERRQRRSGEITTVGAAHNLVTQHQERLRAQAGF